MSKPEWGTKHLCQSCGARFYDMLRTPIVCPKCQAAVDGDVPFKMRRGGAKTPAPAPAQAKVIDEVDEVEALDDEAADADGGDADESGLIEDASDLGEDDDDMAEVMEHLDENIEDEA